MTKSKEKKMTKSKEGFLESLISIYYHFHAANHVCSYLHGKEGTSGQCLKAVKGGTYCKCNRNLINQL